MKNDNKKSKKEFVKLYVPELMQLVESGDEKMCLLMAQCEYWFGHKPDGFYKFMSPAKGDNRAYREGDSWTEEMGMSSTKIANALKPICTPYPSYTAYKNEEGDKFKGKFYCSYYHKPSHQTQYLRNHDITNAALKSLSLEKRSDIFREKHSSKIGNDEKVISGDTETGCPEIIEAEVVYTENTTKTTQESNSEKTQEREDSSHFSPDQIKKEEIKKEEEDMDAMQEAEAEEVYEPSADSVDSPDSRNSMVKAEAAWQSPQKYPVPFPADFELTEEMIGWAESKRPEIDVHESTEKFKINHADNSDKDWLKKWQLWIMNERAAKGTSYAPGKPSQMEEYAKLGIWLKSPGDSEQSKQAVNKPEPVIRKTISPEIMQIHIPNPHADSIVKLSYGVVKPYLMHRDSLYEAYEDALSKSNYPYTQQTFDEGLKYLCDMKIFQSYFKDYYINLFEYNLCPDWMASIDKEILEVDIETYKEIINFITEGVLVLDDVVEKQFSNIDVKELQLFINANIRSNLLAPKGHNIYNAEQYNSNPGYKEEVDKKLQEKGLLDNQ